MGKEKKHEEGIEIKKKKDEIKIYIKIHNINNLANEGGRVGLKQNAETGGQISGNKGKNADQGGQIAGDCGQNANQDGKVRSKGCGKCDEKHKKDKKHK